MYPLAPFRVIKVDIFHSLIAALPASEWVFLIALSHSLTIHFDTSPRFFTTLNGVG